MKMTLFEKSEELLRNAHHASRGVGRYAVPGATMLGGALLTAGGMLFHKQLNAMVRIAVGSALHQVVSATNGFDGRKLLAYAGLQLQPRRPTLALGSLAIGVLAGIAAGSALTIWLAPKVTSSLRPQGAHAKEEPNTNSVEPMVAQAARPTAGTDGIKLTPTSGPKSATSV
jgi:hypothetical protein